MVDAGGGARDRNTPRTYDRRIMTVLDRPKNMHRPTGHLPGMPDGQSTPDGECWSGVVTLHRFMDAIFSLHNRQITLPALSTNANSSVQSGWKLQTFSSGFFLFNILISAHINVSLTMTVFSLTEMEGNLWFCLILTWQRAATITVLLR